MAPISHAFVAATDAYAQTHHVPVLTFEKGQRKDDVVAPDVAEAVGQDQIVLLGKAQEKTTPCRTATGQGPRTRGRYPRLYRSTAMVNHYYFYGVDQDFGPFFCKFSSYFPILSHDCLLGEDTFRQVNQPRHVSGQRVAALRFTDPRVDALLCALIVFRLLPHGFTNPALRALLAPLLGLIPDQFTSGQMTYHLRRLRLHGLIQRIPDSHRSHVTDFGWRVVLFFTRTYARVIRPGLAHIVPDAPHLDSALRQFDQLETAMNDWIAKANLTV